MKKFQRKLRAIIYCRRFENRKRTCYQEAEDAPKELTGPFLMTSLCTARWSAVSTKILNSQQTAQ
jgi:hypothetical protein